MQKNQTHPAALVSKNLLASALIDLLHEKSYKDLTVTEVCHHAQVARRTFYRNFDVLDDVLNFYITDMMTDFHTYMHTYKRETYENILIAYFTFWKQHADTLFILNAQNLYDLIFMQYITLLPEIPFLFSGCHNTDLAEHLLVPTMAFNAGGLWSLLTYWVSVNCAHTPEELAKIVLLH